MRMPVINPPPHRYAGCGFDRIAPRRKDPSWLAARRQDPATRLLLFHDLKPVIAGAPDVRLHMTSVADLGRPVPDDAPLLGERDGRALFAVAIDAEHPLASRSADVRTVSPGLSAEEAGLAAYGRGLAYWHATHGFCSRCGGPTILAEAGHARHCDGCGQMAFPRTDPAVIVLVASGDWCLLGRSPRFPEGMYSTLAGFVEPGESLEDTVRREMLEEAGVTIIDMRYRSSQPWPFPASLMLGFEATAAARTLTIDPEELADARWFHRDELADPERRPVRLPGSDSIARYLIESWLYES